MKIRYSFIDNNLLDIYITIRNFIGSDILHSSSSVVTAIPLQVSFETDLQTAVHSDEERSQENEEEDFSIQDVSVGEETATVVSSVPDYEDLLPPISQPGPSTIGSSVVRGVQNVDLGSGSSSSSSEPADYEGLVEKSASAKRKREEFEGSQESASSKKMRSSEEDEEEEKHGLNPIPNLRIYEKKDPKGKEKE
ncbi:hypothetical protein BD770DRAFT_450051 [Pilaira anomala]|nr:hypothetical protein BD770DRAFT_450051 [Pilaira anomala]